jgi:putative ABC transport system permease protein
VEGPEYHIDVAPGTNIKAYIDQLNKTLQPLNAQAEPNTSEISSIVVAMDTLAGTLTLLLVVVAALGVLNTVVLDTRDRVHDLGVFKALGMSPRQTVAMVLTSVGAIGLIAGVIGVPESCCMTGCCPGWDMPPGPGSRRSTSTSTT